MHFLNIVKAIKIIMELKNDKIYFAICIKLCECWNFGFKTLTIQRFLKVVEFRNGNFLQHEFFEKKKLGGPKGAK